uniref:Uncharacterized protein n=1 Tax=Manihot esculenta TaxID=3983 RepID=A0A2C9VAY3_MANES
MGIYHSEMLLMCSFFFFFYHHLKKNWIFLVISIQLWRSRCACSFSFVFLSIFWINDVSDILRYLSANYSN